MSPLLTLLSSILLVAAPGRARADQSASPEESYRAALREAFLHAAPPPSPPSKADLGDPNDPKSTAGLARTIVALEAGTAADPLASIRAEAAAFSAASPAMPSEDVVADYLRRRKAAGGASVKGPTGTPPPDRGTPDSARGAQLHALELANALGSTAGPGGAPTPAVATVPSAVPATNALPRAPTAVSDLRASAPPSPSVGAPAAAPGLLAGFGTWSLETGRGYATGAANLVLDAANLSNRGANALLSLTPIQYRFQQDMHIAPASATERYAQNAVQAASLLSGGAGLVRSAPELAALGENLAARAGALGDRLAGRGVPEAGVAAAGEKTFLGMSYADIAFEEVFDPQAFAKLAEAHPEVRVIADDEKFKTLDGLSRAQADQRIEALYPGNYNQGYRDWNAYLNRKLWREQSGGRPIPGDPGGPPVSDVDKMMGSPRLPPLNGAGGVAVPGGVGGGGVTLYNDVSGGAWGEVNAYAADLKRLGALPYSIKDGGRELNIGHMYVDSSARSQSAGAIRTPGIGTPMIAEMIRANPEAIAVKAVLAEDNGQAFYAVFAKSHDYFEGIRNTPLYKALARQGFTKIAPPPQGWQESPFIPFEVGK